MGMWVYRYRRPQVLPVRRLYGQSGVLSADFYYFPLTLYLLLNDIVIFRKTELEAGDHNVETEEGGGGYRPCSCFLSESC